MAEKLMLWTTHQIRHSSCSGDKFPRVLLLASSGSARVRCPHLGIKKSHSHSSLKASMHHSSLTAEDLQCLPHLVSLPPRQRVAHIVVLKAVKRQ